MSKPKWFTDAHWNALDLARMEGLPAHLATMYLDRYKLSPARNKEAFAYYIHHATAAMNERSLWSCIKRAFS